MDKSNLDNEIWKDIPGYKKLYQASSFGRIRSVDRIVIQKNLKARPTKGKIMKIFYHRVYPIVFLSRNSKVNTHDVHRLIAKTFIQNQDNFPVVNHKDGNKLNNHVDNLEWCTYSYNQKHAVDSGLRIGVGEKHYKAKLTNDHVLEIKCLYLTDEYTIKQLAEKFKVSHHSVRDLLHGTSWKTVGEVKTLKPTKNGGNRKLSKLQVIEIRKCSQNGESRSAISEKFKTPLSTIHKIVAGETWKNVA